MTRQFRKIEPLPSKINNSSIPFCNVVLNTKRGKKRREIEKMMMMMQLLETNLNVKGANIDLIPLDSQASSTNQEDRLIREGIQIGRAHV